MPITATNIVNNATANNSTPGTALATSYTPSANSSIVVVVAWDDTSTPTVTCSDPTDGSYTSLTPQNGTNPVLDTVDNQKFQCFFLAKCTAGTRNINLSWTASSAFRWCKVVEIQGQAQSGAVIDGFSTNYQNSLAAGNNVTSQNATNSNQPALILGIAYNSHDATTPPTANTGAGFTQLESEATTGSCTEILRITTTGADAATFGNTASSQWISFGLKLDESLGGPTFTLQPANQSVFVGQAATFTATATGTGTIHYQWQANGVNVGADSSSYTTGTLAYADNGTIITVTATDDNGSTPSNQAILSVSFVATVGWLKA